MSFSKNKNGARDKQVKRKTAGGNKVKVFMHDQSQVLERPHWLWCEGTAEGRTWGDRGQEAT